MNCNLARKFETFDAPFSAKDYRFSVDWLNIRLDYDDPIALIGAFCKLFPRLLIENFEKRDKGVCFYKKAYFCNLVGHSGFVINWNENEDGTVNVDQTKREPHGILLSISGDGCRFINSLADDGFRKFVQFLGDNFNCHCSRIDMACDILDADNPIVPMIQTFGKYAYDDISEMPVYCKCNLNKVPGYVQLNAVRDEVLKAFTMNVTIGQRDCYKGQLQLYNKRVEIEQKGGRLSPYGKQMLDAYGNPDYWYRIEYRCKSFAQKVFEQLYKSNSIYKAFLESAHDFGGFYRPVDRNVERSLELAEWVMFLDFVTKLDGNRNIHFVQFVAQPFVRTSIDRLKRHYKEDRPASFISELLICFFDEKYRSELLKEAIPKLLYDPRYAQVRDDFYMQYGVHISGAIDRMVG